MRIEDFRGRPVVSRWKKKDGRVEHRYITPTRQTYREIKPEKKPDERK